MGAFKKFNSQDVYISTYTANKSFVASGSQYTDIGIINIPAHSGSGVYIPNARNINKNYDRRLAFESIHHLYYSSFVDGEIPVSSSFENYLQSSFNVSGSRILNEISSIYSIPKTSFGTALKPGDVELEPDSDTDRYVDSNYALNLYEDIPGRLYGASPAVNLGAAFNLMPTLTAKGHTEVLVDDGEGNLFLKNVDTKSENTKKVGNIIYTHGQILINDNEVARYYNNYIDGKIQWKSSHPIYTYNFHCKLKESEFTHTFNPSAIDGNNGDIADNVAGKEFSPYFTTIGLYNDANELIAIAKPGQPIPISKDSDMTVVVKLDI